MRYAVILAGGGGTRLWPASRRRRPKQFLELGKAAGESLLGATHRRLAPSCPKRTLVVSSAAQADEVRASLPMLGADDLVLEPAARNTAAALGLAAVHLRARDPKAVMGAIPSDHHVDDETEFSRVIASAFALAESRDVIVTVGIVPTGPETGFGYLEVGDEFAGEARHVARFVEKPDRPTAERYLEAGNFLWNAGMFFVSAERLLREIEQQMPETHRGLAQIADALSGGAEEARRVTEQIYPTLPSISIDYGVMERASDVLTIPGTFGWNDVGSWSALADYREADSHANVIAGVVVTHDASENIIISDDETVIAAIGVEGLVIVKAGDAVLVVPKHRAQEVREAVRALEESKLERFL